MIRPLTRILAILLACGLGSSGASEPRWRAGFARIDITPSEPVRMTGYADRDHASEGVQTPLHVRAIAIEFIGQPIHLLVSIENIGLSGKRINDLAQRIEQSLGVQRQQIVFANTHTHAAPDLVDGLDNILLAPLSDAEAQARQRYSEQLNAAVLRAAAEAVADRSAADISFGRGAVDFAVNRRLLRNGKWVTFGVQSDGPVDHDVLTLRVSGPDGTLRGVMFNYACHCTTLTGQYYKIHADWAGVASTQIEKINPGCVAICTIGCGADANPEPRGTPELATRHGMSLADEVMRIVQTPMSSVEQPIVSHFDYAGLPFDLPTADELNQRAKSEHLHYRRNAEHWMAELAEHRRLPATYPVPVQTWRFGDDMTMVFLGGEVVVDYALRLRRELNDPNLWISAYCNDVMGYVASERMRAEGGYEFDRSAVYYNLPGPWATGTEDLLIGRVHEMLQSDKPPPALTPPQARAGIRVPDGLEVQLVAAEPLIQDPINLAFGADGRLWVVEMGDYPGTDDSPEGRGRIKILSDSDGDGVYDAAQLFLDHLSFATAVHPWADGAIVAAAPDIFFARDTDGDGRADDRETWVTGFPLANPQHRVNGFAYGLDHSLHCASGDNLGEVTAVRTGLTHNASGHDVCLFPTTGAVEVISGRTQYIRSRNDWGQWFGNDNSHPMFHYPIKDRYLRRNRAVSLSGNQHQLFDPPSAPAVYPISNTADRFNDLHTAGRFTSACSSIVFRSDGLGVSLLGEAFVCEPVHNLIHRAHLVPEGSTYHAVRVEAELNQEFLASDDPDFRPVRVIEGTDGMLWVVDMQRPVIEHPQWIPESWQSRLDLRAGSDRGRIYRVAPAGSSPQIHLPDISGLAGPALVKQLTDPSGAVRDLAQQLLLMQPASASVTAALEQLLKTGDSPATRVQAIWCLEGMGHLDVMSIAEALHDNHFGVVCSAVLLSESRLDSHPYLLDHLAVLATHSDSRVKLQLALSLGECSHPTAGKILARMSIDPHQDFWLTRGLICSASHHAPAMLSACLKRLQDFDEESTSATMTDLLTSLIQTAAAGGDWASLDEIATVLQDVSANDSPAIPLATAYLDATKDIQPVGGSTHRLVSLHTEATDILIDENAESSRRCQSISLMGRGLADDTADERLLVDLISPRVPPMVQMAAITRLGQIGHPSGATALLRAWGGMSQPVREATVNQMLRLTPWRNQLLSAMERGSIQPHELTPAAKQSLQTIGDASSRALATRLLRPLGSADRDSLVSDYLRAIDATDGNGVRGGALFQTACAACHQPDAAGRMVGPSLSNLTNRTDRALLEAILDPNRAVDPQFLTYSVLTDDGRVFSGAIAEESGDNVTLALADASRVTIARADIDMLQNTGISLMPQGFESLLTPAAMADLLRFLQSGLEQPIR